MFLCPAGRRSGGAGLSKPEVARMRVEIRESEGFDQLLRRFTKGIERSGILREHRRGLRFISTQEESRAKRRKAERRRRRTN
jgi:small subunit ribosomal protein S21